MNNLIDPKGHPTAKQRTLGNVLKAGRGPASMILIPGLGFSGNIFSEFMAPFEDEYTMYAVTLAGFGGTNAPPSPPESTSFGDQTWTTNALEAIEDLMREEGIRNPVVVGHWLTGTQIALRLALNNPQMIRAVILLSGSAKMVVADTAYTSFFKTPEQRVASIDRWLAPRWFKTVTRETWDDNNFLPGDYAVNPVRALRMWREAASPRLHVWVRYLCEFNAQDITTRVKDLRVPTLLLKPGLEGVVETRDQNYMQNYCHLSWNEVVGVNKFFRIETIPHARVFMWFDRPNDVQAALSRFLASLGEKR